MSIKIPGQRRGLQDVYTSMPDEVQAFFSDLPALINSDFSLNIALAYMFFRIEQGQRQMLYYGARKLHRTESQLTWKIVDSQHLTRDAIKEKFEIIYGFPISDTANQYIKEAEGVRNALMHGQKPIEAKQREAICKVMYYAEEMNEHIAGKLNFRPFTGDQRGIVGRREFLDKSTTRWILKGMGFKLS